MCGIYFHYNQGGIDSAEVRLHFNKMNHRGPDHSEIYQINKNVVMGFHRLSINDTSTSGHQPFELDDLIMVCNGEIFNYKELEAEFDFPLRSWSDCEVILHLFKYYYRDLDKVLSKINGEFAFVIYDTVLNRIYAARDPIGIRPLFFYQNKQNICLLSEAKGTKLRPCFQLPPGIYTILQAERDDSRVFEKYPPCAWGYKPYVETFVNANEPKQLHEQMMQILREAVYCRVKTTEREIGCFLSGGVDSLITTYFTIEALKRLGRNPKQLKVFTTGFKGCESADVAAATQIARILDIDHHIYTPTVETGLAAITRTIYHLESWDTTTIRASVPQYLLSKYISENTNVRVLISGEGSDELLGGYLYFNNVPNKEAFVKEREILLSYLPCFDVLRTDRTTAANGLEVRVPFLDSTFVAFVKSLDCELLMPNSEQDKQAKMTKRLLRTAFSEYLQKNSNLSDGQLQALQPYIWRTKDAFSDAVGHRWVDCLQEHTRSLVEGQWTLRKFHYHALPPTNEASYYRRVFTEFFGDRQVETIPHYWMPKWQSVSLKDPSARFLKTDNAAE